jgi:hypothetical protein
LDPFESHADLIPQWLKAEADVDSQELLDILIALHLERHGSHHRRKLQRIVRNWRVARLQQCLENAAKLQEAKTETRQKELPGAEQKLLQIVGEKYPST